MYISRSFIQAIACEIQWYGPDFKQAPRCVADSRNLVPGDIFLAIKGRRDDGHAYIEQALTSGAAGFVIEKSSAAAYADFIARVQVTHTVLVADGVYDTLVRIARAWRSRFHIPIVGITGTVGKTSTKELAAALVRAAHKKFLISPGTYNTLLGCAITLLQLTDEHEGAILEMGINKPGEMEKLAGLVRPTIGVITRIGHGHLEGLGSCASVALEKRALFTYFTQESIGIVPGDQPEVSAISYRHQTVRFGKKIAHQIQLRKIVMNQESISAILKIYGAPYPVTIPTVQQEYLNTVLAAAAIAHVLGIDHAVIQQRVQEPFVVARRFEKHELAQSRGILIDDAYNANPESMKAALIAFDKLPGVTKKIAVLGDMLELGSKTAFWHRQIGRFLSKTSSISHVILVGPQAALMQKTVPVGITSRCVASWREATSEVNQLTQQAPGDTRVAVLLKASRGVALHHMIDYVVQCVYPPCV